MTQPIIKLDYAAAAAMEQQIQSSAGVLGENLEELRGRLLQITWTGEDEVAFRMHMTEWESAVQNLNNMLPEIRAAVLRASERFHDNEMRGVKRWTGG